MPLERRNPLPEGRYSIMVIGPADIAAFNEWLVLSRHSVNVEVTEPIAPTSLESALNVKEFVIFNVTEPVIFESKRFGFPDKAGPEIKSSADTVQAPDLPSSDETTADIATGIKALAGAVALLSILRLFKK